MNDEIVHDAGDDAPATPQVSESNPDVETLRKENETLRSEIRASKARAALTAELTVAGARSPELLIAAAEKDIQFDDQNAPVNVAAVIARLTSADVEACSKKIDAERS